MPNSSIGLPCRSARREGTPIESGELTPTVLFVDDEESVLASIERNLHGSGYRILTSSSASLALSVLRRESVDVLVADEHMPGLCGSALLVLAAELRPRIVSMLLSGNTTIDAAKRAVNGGGVFRLLDKPCSVEQLHRALADAVAHQKRTDASPANLAAVGAISLHVESLISRREQEVLAELMAGKRVRQIAESLYISEHTVRNHVKAMFRKFGVHSQAQLIALACVR